MYKTFDVIGLGPDAWHHDMTGRTVQRAAPRAVIVVIKGTVPKITAHKLLINLYVFGTPQDIARRLLTFAASDQPGFQTERACRELPSADSLSQPDG